MAPVYKKINHPGEITDINNVQEVKQVLNNNTKRILYFLATFLLLILLISGFIILKTHKSKNIQSHQNKPITKIPLPRPEKGQRVFRLAEGLTLDYPATIGDLEFARLVSERSGGRLKIIVYYGAKLGDEKSVIEQVRFGGIDFARVNAAPLSEVYHPLAILSLPYLFRDTEHLWKVLNGPVGQELLAGLAHENLVGLAYYSSAARSFYSKHPIRTLSDMKGMKIRVQQSKLYMDLVRALGADPVPIPFGDVYSALLMGEIDGAENNWSSYYEVKHYQLAKYYTVDMHTRTPEVLMVNREIFEELSEEEQAIILSAARDSVRVQREASVTKERSSEAEVRKRGSVIIELTRREKAAFMKAVAPFYTVYEKDYRDLIRRIKDTN